MKNIREEAAIWIQIISAIVIWIVLQLAFFQKIGIDVESLKLLPEVVTIYTIFHLLFIKVGWRLPLAQKWLVPFPDLQGTWQGTLQTTWANPETGIIPPPIPLILVIKQSFDAISCVMYTKESTSRSKAALLIEEDDSGIKELSYNYTNLPDLSARPRSPIHEGAATLRIISTPQKTLKGEYWTNRKTTGEITLTFKLRALLEEFPNDLEQK